MATRGRKPHADPPVDVMVSLPTTLNAKLELLLYDPLTGKPRYGGRSALIQQLIREWVEKQQIATQEEGSSAID
jgi:metal-responsive CopG/Arc/MetJ family transcriptional regulator